MAYHNVNTRQMKFVNPLTGKQTPIYQEIGFYNDWDSVYTTIVAKDYLTKFNIPSTNKNILALLNALQANTTPHSNLLKIRKGGNTD